MLTAQWSHSGFVLKQREVHPYGGHLLIKILAFRTASRSLAAQNFAMPAMSPTMTEGNIANWKVKEGRDTID